MRHDQLPPLLLVDVPPLLLVEPPLLVDPPLLLVDPPLLDVEDPPLLLVDEPPLLLVELPMGFVGRPSFVSGSFVALLSAGYPPTVSTAPPQAPTAERRRTERKMEEGSRRRSMRRARQLTCPTRAREFAPKMASAQCHREPADGIHVAYPRALRRLLLLLMLLVVIGGCGRCSKKTDAELAAEERAKAEEMWKGSLALTPWRALKGAERSRGEPNRPDVYKKIDAAMEVLQKPAKAGTGPEAEADAKARSEATFELLKYMLLHRSEFTKHDEDLFPRLMNVWEKTKPPLPALWYDNPAEHLVMAFAVLAIDQADKSDRVPARDIVFYELSRSEPQPAWPETMRAAGRYARGLSFVQHALHYAAEEDLTGYIKEVVETDPNKYALGSSSEPIPGTKVPPWIAAKETLLAAGYFTRAYNRQKLEREDPATDDMVRGLECFEHIGVENELTLWTGAVVYQRKGRYDDSARNLEKLADSSFLDDEAKKDIRAAAADVKKQSKEQGWFHEERTTMAVTRAVIARLGGAENILAFFIGKEEAHSFFAPFEAMSKLREQLRDAAKKESAVAEEKGKKAFGDLKGKLEEAGAPH